jgi:hypothetical protein
MIINLPEESDYKRNAIECWVQAFDTLYEIEKHIEDLELDSQLTTEIYEFSQPHYRTAIVLLHQGMEAFMKSRICRQSPLLLVDNKRTDWPVLPNQIDKDFNDFFTIGAEALLYTFCAVASDMDQDTVAFLERIRKLRNKIVHGFNTEQINSGVILEDIITCFTTFCGKDSWWMKLGDSIGNIPYFPTTILRFQEQNLQAD